MMISELTHRAEQFSEAEAHYVDTIARMTRILKVYTADEMEKLILQEYPQSEHWPPQDVDRRNVTFWREYAYSTLQTAVERLLKNKQAFEDWKKQTFRYVVR